MKRTACVAMVKNEENHIAEWIGYQIAIGFDTVILLDNCSTDNTKKHAEKLAHYADVRVLDWSIVTPDSQLRAYEHSVQEFGYEFDWMAFFDSDEFLVPNSGLELHSVLDARRDAAALAIPWSIFGSSGHRERPDGLIVENFLHRSEASFGPNRHVKSVIRPNTIRACLNPHAFDVDGAYQTLAGETITWAHAGVLDHVPDYSYGKLHHYFTRSWQHWMDKLDRGYRDVTQRKLTDFQIYDRNEVQDTSALWFPMKLRDVMSNEVSRSTTSGCGNSAYDLLQKFTPQQAFSEIASNMPTDDLRQVIHEEPDFFFSEKTDLIMESASSVILTKKVDKGEFSRDSNSHIIVHNSEFIRVEKPDVLNVPEGGIRFCGPFYLLPNVGQTPKSFPNYVQAPDLTLTRMSNIICLPGQIALVRPESSNHEEKKFILLEESLSDKWGKGNINLTRYSDNQFVLDKSFQNPKFIQGSYLYLDCMHGPHYGHFLVDVLSMAWGFSAALNLGLTGLKVLIPGHSADYMVPMLEAVGIPAFHIFNIDFPVECEEVIFASKSFFTQGWTSSTAIETWRRIRNAFYKPLNCERVYISRRKIGNRPLRNEAEVEKVFEDHGFLIFHPQDHSISHQIAIWANAKFIAGTAGSNMFNLAFQERLESCFLINSPNLLHFQEIFLQAGNTSKTTIFFGNAFGNDPHSPWEVPINPLVTSVNDWLKIIPCKTYTGNIVIKPMGNVGNRMIQYLAAQGIRSHCPEANILDVKLEEWSIFTPKFDDMSGCSISFGADVHKLNVQGVASCISRKVIDTVFLDCYAQHFENFPKLEACRSFFRASSDLDIVSGFGDEFLVCSIRGKEILDGRHPDYLVLPPSFYQHLVNETGLKPVFFGQIEDNLYCKGLRDAFPSAEFITGQGGLYDFEVIRRSSHIVPSISTYSWLAAWLSYAKTIFLPVAGLFNPRQARAHYFLPLDDHRYRFYLFPVAYSANLSYDPAKFFAYQALLDNKHKVISSNDLSKIITSAPKVGRDINSYLKFYDEQFYVNTHQDIGAAISAGHLPSGLDHYIRNGFLEERSAFQIIPFEYAIRHPEAALKVSNGEYLDFAHHYVEVGAARGYKLVT
jgi:hypothetical protein